MAKVLVIDDEPGVRKVIAKTLKRAGHSVALANNGKVGMAVFNIFSPDLTIADIIMPEREGIETILEIKKKYGNTKIVAISGGGSDYPKNYLEMAMLLGADAAFTKPLNLDLLVNKVNELTHEPNFRPPDRPMHSGKTVT